MVDSDYKGKYKMEKRFFYKENEKRLKYYKSGILKSISNYNVEGQRHGYFKTFYENGYVQSSYYYKYDRLNGYVVHFYPNGILKSYRMYSYNRKIGFYKNYHENGILRTFFKYDKYGRKDGMILEFYDNGILKSKTQMKNGKKNGKMIKYFQNGNVNCIITYKNDKKNGKSLEFDENNNIIETNSYINDLKDGYYFKFKDNKIEVQGFYILGKKHNKEIQYDENEMIKSIFHYKFGYKDGLQYENIISLLISYYKYNKKILSIGIDNECCICYESTKWITECGHFLCLGCCEKLYNLSCPLCRFALCQGLLCRLKGILMFSAEKQYWKSSPTLVLSKLKQGMTFECLINFGGEG